MAPDASNSSPPSREGPTFLQTVYSSKRKQKIDESKLDPRLLDVNSDYYPPLEVVWKNVLLFAVIHTFSIYGLYLFITGEVQWRTVLWTGFYHLFGAFGITAGVHRLWSHKAFKAKLPLRVILAFMQTVSYQNSIHEWARDHRVHHKYAETHADPHNAKRGFFFAHMGWLMCRKHPMVIIKGREFDISDLESDPVVMFQKRHYAPLALLCSFIIPTLVPWYFWGETLIASWCFAAQLRYCFNLHCTWLVNSAAHTWGNRPYEKSMYPAENKTVAILAFGEGWHNFHHTFPWDYRTDELGMYKYNFTTAFLDFFAWIGWAYDFKTVSHKMIAERIMRTGDGTHPSLKKSQDDSAGQKISENKINADGHHGSQDDGHIHAGPWGWGDTDIPKEDIEVTQTLYPLRGTSKSD